MDILDNYQRIIKEVLVPYTQIPYSHAAIECKTVFDSENNSYLLITLGWDGVKRDIYRSGVHFGDVTDGAGRLRLLHSRNSRERLRQRLCGDLVAHQNRPPDFA